MINFKDEIERFKPSLEVGDIEKEIAKADLTDMNDIMICLMSEATKPFRGSAGAGDLHERL